MNTGEIIFLLFLFACLVVSVWEVIKLSWSIPKDVKEFKKLRQEHFDAQMKIFSTSMKIWDIERKKARLEKEIEDNS